MTYSQAAWPQACDRMVIPWPQPRLASMKRGWMDEGSQTPHTRRMVSTSEEQKGCITAGFFRNSSSHVSEKYCPVHLHTIIEQTTLWCNTAESFRLLTVLSTSMLKNVERANCQDLDGFFGCLVLVFFVGRSAVGMT